MEESSMDKGFTKMPNILLNSIIRKHLTGVEMKLILVIWRYSGGFLRDSAELSVAYLAREIGSDPSVVSRQLSRLIESGVVKVSYVNPKTKVRALMINNDIENWGIDQKSSIDQQVNSGIDQQVNRVLTNRSTEVLTNRSTNKDNNINIYLKIIKERAALSPKLEQGFIKWLEYKTERGEVYGKIPLRTLATTVREKSEKWGEEAVLDVINDCIASGYKNIVWEKLKLKEISRVARMHKSLDDQIDHLALEKLSRGTRNDK